MTPNPPDEALQGGNVRPLLGPRSSSSERVKRACIVDALSSWSSLRGRDELESMAQKESSVSAD
eukprot:15304554-Alexandrium_andersonii.AAC.1